MDLLWVRFAEVVDCEVYTDVADAAGDFFVGLEVRLSVLRAGDGVGEMGHTNVMKASPSSSCFFFCWLLGCCEPRGAMLMRGL